MAGFKTHITTSTILGIGYGAARMVIIIFRYPLASWPADLCSVSGMLPDIDSDSGRPLRESMSFGAAVVPMMMVDRFKAMGMDLESIILAGGAIYLAIRFGLAAILKRLYRASRHVSQPAGVRDFRRSRIPGLRLRTAGIALLCRRRGGCRFHVAFDSRRNLERRNAARPDSFEKQLWHRH